MTRPSVVGYGEGAGLIVVRPSRLRIEVIKEPRGQGSTHLERKGAMTGRAVFDIVGLEGVAEPISWSPNNV